MASDPADPFSVFGLTPAATLDELRAARRALAKRVHPDREGGDAGRMQAINRAFDLAVKRLRSGASAQAAPAAPPPASSPSRPPSPGSRVRPAGRWVDIDEFSFTIDVLPVEAFEALTVVASWYGETVDDDPPYLLDVVLGPPLPCLCRFTLMPEAGGSMVSLAVASVDAAHRPPSAEAIRDLFVAGLNSLGDSGY